MSDQKNEIFSSQFKHSIPGNMTDFDLYFLEIDYHFPMVFVKGTGENTYLWGEDLKMNIRINDFYISKYPVTRQFWNYVMEINSSNYNEKNKPVDNVSYNDIKFEKGFLKRLNALKVSHETTFGAFEFRLPSETEWEYAARGGTHWKDGLTYSGSNDINAVGWYENNAGRITDPAILRLLKNTAKGTETHEVGRKSPNQLGIYDMSGNVWEWCEDYFQDDATLIPPDGTPCRVASAGRVLRGGCHHNWAIHCTVYKRYQISPDAADGCIGFRIAASI